MKRPSLILLSLIIVLTFSLYFLTPKTFALTSTLFNDDFLSPTQQLLTVYNSNYFNLATSDNNETFVNNGKVYHLDDRSGFPQDFYTYTGLGQITNPCSTVTAVIPSNGELSVILSGSPFNIFNGVEYYYINLFGGNHVHYLEPLKVPEYLGDLDVDLTVPHKYSICIENDHLTFSVDDNIIDERDGPFQKYFGGNATFGYAGFGLTESVYLTNFKVSQILPNQAPVIQDLSGVTLNEGEVYLTNGLFTDSGSSSWTATVDYGDGSGVQPLTLTGQNFSLNHTYQDNGNFQVTVSITDNQNETDTASAAVNVNNVKPSIGDIIVNTIPVQVNNPITASASFTDSGVLDTHTAAWDWGDGNTSVGTVTESFGSGSITDSHIYIASGVYTITLTLVDNDNSSETKIFQYVSVYNSSAQGLFTGNRIFNSPEGAYPQNPTLTGQVFFGVTARYQGATPTGNVSLDFKAADFEFEANIINILVMSNNAAMLRGTGTINGSGNYHLLVTGLDSTDDTIRFQIKELSGLVIYDSQPNAPDTATPASLVTAGQVIVH